MIADGTKLIVGLGNPGLIYATSRHNIGFAVLKSLASSLKINFKRDSSVSSAVARDKLSQQDVVLALPQTYMNLSGIAVKALLKKFKVDPEDLLVVCDDLDLELCRFLRVCLFSVEQLFREALSGVDLQTIIPLNVCRTFQYVCKRTY